MRSVIAVALLIFAVLPAGKSSGAEIWLGMAPPCSGPAVGDLCAGSPEPREPLAEWKVRFGLYASKKACRSVLGTPPREEKPSKARQLTWLELLNEQEEVANGEGEPLPGYCVSSHDRRWHFRIRWLLLENGPLLPSEPPEPLSQRSVVGLFSSERDCANAKLRRDQKRVSEGADPSTQLYQCESVDNLLDALNAATHPKPNPAWVLLEPPDIGGSAAPPSEWNEAGTYATFTECERARQKLPGGRCTYSRESDSDAGQ